MASDVPRYDCPSNELYGVTYRTATNGPPSVKAEGCSFPSDVKLSLYATGSGPVGDAIPADNPDVANPAGDARPADKNSSRSCDDEREDLENARSRYQSAASDFSFELGSLQRKYKNSVSSCED
jgi:hypothetical protein